MAQISGDIALPELNLQGSHPMDSSRVLLALMALSRRASASQNRYGDGDSVEGIISRRIMRSLLSALHLRDVSTVRHSRQVAMLAVGIARALGWESRHLKVLEVASLLHDIGKLGVPDNILFKPGKLSPDELDLVAMHYHIGIDVLQACMVDCEVLDIIVQAHSHFNGASHGFQRIGSEVHQGARILAVADAYDSLATDQVYRDAKSHDEIMKILHESSGTQFDGNIVAALDRWFQREGKNYQECKSGLAVHETPPGMMDPEETLEASSLAQIFSYLYLLESLYDGFYLVDMDKKFVLWNHGAEQLFQHPARKMLRQTWSTSLLPYTCQYGESEFRDRDCPLSQVLESGRAATNTVQIRRADGQWILVELQSVPLVDRHGNLHGVAEIFRDLSSKARKFQSYRELALAASRDPLTAIANRGELESQLGKLVHEYNSRTDPEKFSVMILDVDHFKKINDTYGHDAGDRVLVDVARLLQHETYSGEMVGRYGGEEFVVICPDTDLKTAFRRAERLRLTLSRSTVGDISHLRVTASLGVSQMEAGDTMESLMRRSDKALYMAKAGGRNCTRSLTSEDLQEKKAPPKPDDPFVFRSEFETFLNPDILIYKLGGFVTDQKAKLVKASENEAVIRIGSAGLLPFWGKAPDTRPVELHLQLGQAIPDREDAHFSRNPKLHVKVEIRPLGWIRDPAIFREQASSIMRTLRGFFVV